MNTALETAQYFLNLAAEHGGKLDEPALQRLCFYAQGYNLAMRREPLFGDTIQICDEGPVIEGLRRTFGQCGESRGWLGAALEEDTFGFFEGLMLRDLYRDFRAEGERERITAEQAGLVLDAVRRGDTPLSFERCMEVSFWAALERQPRLPMPDQGDLEEAIERGRADIAAGRYRSLR